MRKILLCLLFVFFSLSASTLGQQAFATSSCPSNPTHDGLLSRLNDCKQSCKALKPLSGDKAVVDCEKSTCLAAFETCSKEVFCASHPTHASLAKALEDCKRACKAMPDAKGVADCVRSACERPVEVCSKKPDSAASKDMHCHDPIVACLSKCPKGTGRDTDACKSKCGSGDTLKKYQACLKN